MLYLVHMVVRLPHDLDPQLRTETIEREKRYSQDLQREGKWVNIWRVVGQYANYSVFDVDSHGELHQILSALPLFPYMDIQVTPLATHPSDVNAPSGG